MKKIQSTLIFFLLGFVFFSLFLSSCKKNITENINLNFKPTLFEYTGLIQVMDAADSTAPNNLQIVFSEGQENMLYSILGDKDLKFSSAGTLEFGLHPAIKPTSAEPVIVRFELQAPGYISESLSIEFYEGKPSIRKNFSLMNKSNLPKGVSYTEFSGSIKNGVTEEDIIINLGGGQSQIGYKNSQEDALNTVTIHAGAKFYYWDYDPNRDPRFQRTEVVETGQITGQAYFYEYFQGDAGYRYHANAHVVDNGDTTAVPVGNVMAGFGGWYFGFKLNGEYVYPDYDQPGEFSATANLSLPKYGFNLETGQLYKAGDVIKLYNHLWAYSWNSWGVDYIYDIVSTQVLSESSSKNSDYFALEPIELDNISMLWIGSITPAIDYFDYPEIRVQGDNSPPSWNNWDGVYQHLEKTFQYNGQEYSYYFGSWYGAINQPTESYNNGTIPTFSFIPGTYKKYTSYQYTDNLSNGPSFSIFRNDIQSENLTISAGSPHPFDFVIPAGKLQRVTLNYSIKCDNATIKPSVTLGVGSLWGPDDTEVLYIEHYIWGDEGFASSYLLKVGQAYKFYIQDPRDGTFYMRIDTVKSANTVIEIDNAEVCDFIDNGGF